MFSPCVSGTPRASAEVYDEASKYGKQIKRESPPIRSFEGGITKGKPYEGVNTIKEMGRSIHEIPRKETQDSRKTPVLEGSITQVQDLKLLLFHILKCIYEEHSNHIQSSQKEDGFECLIRTISLHLPLIFSPCIVFSPRLCRVFL